MVFDDASLGDAEAPWLALLDQGALPAREPADDPGAWISGDPWQKRLAASTRKNNGRHWLTYLHFGAAAYRAKKVAAAVAAWKKSVAMEPTAWAYRNLACIARAKGRKAEAADFYQKAAPLAPDLAELQLEVGRALADADRSKELEQWIAGLPAQIRELPRVEILVAQTEMWRGQLDQALARLEAVHITDNREGDNAISDLWYEIKARQAAVAEGVPFSPELLDRVTDTLEPPAHLDYRMAKPPKKTRKKAKK
jgi:tetratricopeptide (TPR) repeat protein